MGSKKIKKKSEKIADDSMDLAAAENGHSIDELKSENKKELKKLDSDKELACNEKEEEKKEKKKKRKDSVGNDEGSENIKELGNGSVALRKKVKLEEVFEF